MKQYKLSSGKVLDLDDFTVRFTGRNEKHRGVRIKNGRLFRVSYKWHDDLRGWEWFDIRPVNVGLFEAEVTCIPYSSFDTFFDNWEVVCE